MGTLEKQFAYCSPVMQQRRTALTLQALRDKHPSSILQYYTTIPATLRERIGCYRERSQECYWIHHPHIKYLIGTGCGETGELLLKDLTSFINFMLAAEIIVEITGILYAVSLCAQKKKDRSVRPIAVGTVYRHLMAKCCCKKGR